MSTNMSTTDAEKHVSSRGCLKSRRSRIIAGLVVLIVILAAVIPPVVVTTLRKKHNNSMGPKSKVFVPLYVYPAPGAWSPLEDVYVSLFQFSPIQTPTRSLPRSPSPIQSQATGIARHIQVAAWIISCRLVWATTSESIPTVAYSLSQEGI